MAKIQEPHSETAEFYRERSVFITGGTGYIGKVLIEKLLRSCSGIKRIYVLIREHEGIDPTERLKQLLELKLFHRVRKEQPDVHKKISCIYGDLTLENLGISAEDYNVLIEEVSVIFHLGAIVNFNEKLKLQLRSNVYGTKLVMDLARRMHRLQALVHVSTAYCNTHEKDIYEKVYPMKISSKHIIGCLSWMNDELMEGIRPILISDYPNNYCYSKHLAEQLLTEEGKDLPIIIVRPTIVHATYKEPIEGWTDSSAIAVHGYILYAKGMMRAFYNPTPMVDIVPVDVCVNLLLVSAWGISQRRDSDRLIVYHCSTSTVNAANTKERFNALWDLAIKYPSMKAWRYPRITISNNKFLYEVTEIAYHAVPAMFGDLFCIIFGMKPWMFPLYKKCRALDTEFFATRSWSFHAHNRESLLEIMSDIDKKKFDLDPRNIDWDKFMNNFGQQARECLLNEDPSTLELARKRMIRLHHMDIVIHVLVIGAIAYILPSGIWDMVTNSILNIASLIPQF